MYRDRTMLFDGTTYIELSKYPDEAWTWLSGKSDADTQGLQDYYKAIPWLFRGVSLRADAVSKMPFIIMRGDNEIDSSNDYKNVVGFFPYPRRLLKLVEMSMTLMGRSYLFRSRNTRKTLGLRYLNPTTIKPDIDEVVGLKGFIRTLSTGPKPLDIEDIVYFWYEDPWVELGPPIASPGKAALMASGVLANVDEFVAGFFKRGAIKVTLFTAKGMPPGDRDKFLEWWKRFVGGVRNAFTTQILNAETMQPVVVGEGLEGLAKTTLTREKQEDISTALSIPHTLLFADAANFATARQDDYHFYDKFVVPETETIEEVLNEQIFNVAGYRLKFMPQTLDIFQEDEKERSASYLHYIQAKMPPSVAVQILGIELPLGIEPTSLDEFAENMREAIAGQWGMLSPMDKPSDDGKNIDLEKWRRKALNRIKAGNPPRCNFESDVLPDDVIAYVWRMLAKATDEGDVNTIFNNAKSMKSDADYLPLIDKIDSGMRALMEVG